jgi:hypothetical protein
VGNITRRSGFSAEMHRVRASNNDSPQISGKKHERYSKKGLKRFTPCGIVDFCEILLIPCFFCTEEARDQKEVTA